MLPLEISFLIGCEIPVLHAKRQPYMAGRVFCGMRALWLVGALWLVAASGCLNESSSREAVRVRLDLITSGLDDPVFATTAGDASGRIFIVQQGGQILVWNGALLPQPFLDLRPLVSCCAERGLLGLAFHPNYAENGRFFVHYTATNGDITIAEYHNPTPAANVANPNSGRILLVVDHHTYSNHNGGMLAFGPDGMLYAALGDGGSSGDPPNNAQNLSSLLGKILRLDVNTAGRLCLDEDLRPIPYCIPSDNPFVGRAGRDEIWHYGLRNPWRFSFDRATGDMWIGDVGQNQREEINLAPAGQRGMNFGWSHYEGSLVYNPNRPAPGAVPPVAEYDNDARTCSVTGGYVYRGTAIPALRGGYVFADYCAGLIWTLRQTNGEWTHHVLLQRSFSFLASFGEDEQGELLVVDHAGDVHRMVPR
jgi:glucose/arabinose dehydrogenase